ncbi:MAG: hypothetical protein ACEQSD_11645 [Flavobacteriales bacterium]
MTNKTNAAYGDKTNMVQQAVGLFAVHMQRNSNTTQANHPAHADCTLY